MVRASTEDQPEPRPRPRRDSRVGDHACRRLRHLSSIQICNFTPFPVRDAVTSALIQPFEQHQFTTEGHFPDDIEVMRVRRRSRRISASSVATLRNATIHDGDEHGDGGSRGRKGSISGASIRSHTRKNSGRVGSSSPQMRRVVSTSTTTSLEQSGEGETQHGGVSFPRPSGFWVDSSQANLEKVIKSRLVQTMITLTAVPSISGVSTDHRNSSPAADTVPDFLSAIHNPSTNPIFVTTPQSYSSWTDTSTSRVKISVYGQLPSKQLSSSIKGKEKAQDVVSSQDMNDGWTLLQEWNIDLNDLVPVPDDRNCANLPFNSPVLTFGSSGRKYGIAPKGQSHADAVDHGHSSDTESDPRTAMNLGSTSVTRHSSPKKFVKKGRVETDEPATPSRRRRGTLRSATWQDLIKLGTLQTCIADTERSMDELIATIHEHALADGASTLHRRVAEQEYVVQTRRMDVASVTNGSDKLRERIAKRKGDLARRRSDLAAAAGFQAADLRAQSDTDRRLHRDRVDLEVLRGQLLPVRKNLITTLSYIFPIDLVSPADLLFTIVSVPLPIPLAQTDPAPPLSLPQHREVTEDSVATSLGYAAILVQLIAAYLGHRLVYPITYIGSRSVIKDEISAMVGPRMFPLYSKGVDTYRFEYGVFLLNKNIEMLMAERDLRALDIRHTLPNLKNLLLTLTDNELPRFIHLQHKLSNQSILSLRTSSPEPSSAASTSSIASQETAPTEETGGGSADGSPSAPTTPTSDSGTTPRKSKGYFGLSPLSGFLRGRYPSSVSSKPSVKVVAESSEEDAATPTASVINPVGDGEDDADRITIRGITVGAGNGADAKTPEARPHSAPAKGHPAPSKELVLTVTPSSPAPPIIS